MGHCSSDKQSLFELDRCLDWIVANEYQRVALQFPDNYLEHACDVAHFLESSSSAKIFVLGDTSYGSCCVDEVAAEHAHCDSLIHFGDACLSAPVRRIPVLFIFCKCDIDLINFETELKKISEDLKYSKEHCALLFDSAFANEADVLHKLVAKFFPSAEVFWLTNMNTEDVTKSSETERIEIGRHVPECINHWQDATLIFIGLSTSPLLPIWLITFTQFSNILHYMSDEKRIAMNESTSAKLLRKRLFLVEKLRDSDSIGLVVGTLAVKGFNLAVARIRQLCKVAQKRLYVFSIGKINEAKLSNFADNVDAFILLSCPFGIILNTGDFYKPILSLFEAEIALNPSKNWFSAGRWTSEFGHFLRDEIGKVESDTVDVSLITNRLRGVNVTANDECSVDQKNHQVVQYSAGNYFANRSWKGLNDEQLGEPVDTKCKTGLEGIPTNYSSENNQ